MASSTKVSPLQVYPSKDFNGLTEANHLSNAYLTEPEKVGDLIKKPDGKVKFVRV